MNEEIVLLLCSTLALIAGVLITRWTHSQSDIELVVPASVPDLLPPAPRVSMIVPARNEARNIRRCVNALLAQDYPNFELIVVDDRSTDTTPQILGELLHQEQRRPGARQASGRLRVVQGTDLPPGWAGKPHALFQGAVQAGGEWLCFIDADTFASPGLISATLQTAQARAADLFTILTDQELGTFWERVTLPVIFTALSVGFPARHVNDPSRPEAIANGQFILVRRSVYAAVGGHQAVRDQIAEDKALAELVKGRGCRLVLADGRAVARTRMYTSLPEIWEGWTKNIFLGMQDRLGLLLFGGVVGLLGALLLPFWLAGGLVWLATAGSLVPAIVVAQAALVWFYLVCLRALVAQAFQISPWYAFSLPIGALLFTAMLFASAFKVLSGQGVTWKGRKYS